VESEHAGGPTRQQLLDQVQALRHENTQLWAWLEQTIDFPEAKRHEFTVTAAAMGLSLNKIGTLLAIVLGTLLVPVARPCTTGSSRPPGVAPGRS